MNEIEALKLRFNLLLAGLCVICLISLPYWIAGSEAPIRDFLTTQNALIEYYTFFFVFLALFAYFLISALKGQTKTVDRTISR